MAFDARLFTPTQWDTAAAKAARAGAVARFLERGCPEAGFTRAVYHTLCQHLFGHIAHYNASGFYDTWFATPAKRAGWVEYVRRRQDRGFYGDPAWTWSDVEPVIADWLESSGTAGRFTREAAADLEQRERAQLAALQEKYG